MNLFNPWKTSAASATFFFTNRSVIFGVINHCELFGNLLPSAKPEPRLCCSEALVRPFIYLELSHIFFKGIYATIILISLPRSIYYVITDFQINTCTYTCINMIRWRIQCNMIPPSIKCCSNDFRHASFLKTDGDWFSDVFDFVDWQHMYQWISI